MQGFFDDKNKEYVIKDMKPRRPWLNYLWNDRTVCQCDQFGRSAGCHIYTDTTFCMQVKILFAFTHRLTEKRKLNCQNHVRCMSYMKNVTILTILPMLHLIWNAEKHLFSRYVNKI